MPLVQTSGFVRVLFIGNLPSHHFVGTTRNNIVTRDWVGTWHRSFRVLRLFEGTAMLGNGLCALSFSGMCPTGYESSRFQFDMEDVNNRDSLGPDPDLVPLSLRNCSQEDASVQLQCTAEHARFPSLVFCCDSGSNSSSQKIYGWGASGKHHSSIVVMHRIKLHQPQSSNALINITWHCT